MTDLRLPGRHHSAASWRPILLKGVVGLTGLAFLLAAGVGVTIHARPTVILCTCIAIASLTWFSPAMATRAVLVLLVITPLLDVIPQLRPEDINYHLLYAALALPVAVVVYARSSRPAFDSGALFLVIVLISALVTLLTESTLAADYGYLLWPATTLAVYLMVLNSRENLHRWLTGSVIGFAVVEAVCGISQSFVGWPVFSSVLPVLFRSDRGILGYFIPGVSASVANGSGTFQHFNGLGSLLALALPLSLGVLLRRPTSAGRILLFGLLAVGLLVTYSRGAWLGGILGCLFFVWTLHPRGSRSWIPLLLAASITAVTLLVPFFVRYYEATQNVSTRVVTWRFAFSAWLEHSSWIPLGSGFGLFQQRILSSDSAVGTQTLSALHSSFLQILLELGVLGLCVFAWFLYTTIRPSLSGTEAAWQTAWQPATLGGILAFLISQSVDNALFAVTGTCAFALIACLRRADARVVLSRPTMSGTDAHQTEANTLIAEQDVRVDGHAAR
jgi:hypothetical protein